MTQFVPHLLNIGIAMPLYFATYYLCKEAIVIVNNEDEYAKKKIMPFNQVFLAGSLTGAISSLIQTPVDHLRICQQKDYFRSTKKNMNAHRREIYRKFGLRGLYLGFNSTLFKQVLAGGIYFYTYEYIMRLFAPKGLGSRHSPIIASFVAGGFAGMNSWLFTYPVDYIKTIMQSQDLDRLKYRNSLQCAYRLYNSQGYKIFFKGIVVTLLRAFPINGFAFLGFQLVMRSVGVKKQ